MSRPVSPASVDLLRDIVERSDVVISVVDDADRLIYANRAYETLFGISATDQLGRTAHAHYDDSVAAPLLRNNQEVRSSRRAISYQEIVPIGGEPRTYLSVKFPLFDGDGVVYAVAAICSDITDMKRDHDELERFKTDLEERVALRTRELHSTQARLELAFDAARMGAWEWRRDGAGERIVWDARLLELHGLEEAPRNATEFYSLMPEPDANRVQEGLATANTAGDGYAYHYRYRHPDGDWRTFEVRGARIQEEGVELSRGVTADVTWAQELRAELDRLAYTDPVTELPNRRLFEDRTEQAIRQARAGGDALALLMLDLDEFKMVNEALGHAAGDRLLRALAQRLVDSLTERDTVARLGGDEFAILLTRLDGRGSALAVADRLHDALSRPFRIADRDLLVNVSIGISTFPDDADSLTDLMRHADAAMYRAKGSNGNRTAIHSGNRSGANLARLTLRSAIQRGIEQGEFSLLYQPRVDLVTRTITSVEALARWRAPDLGDVSPGEFIPAAERSGLIVPLGRELLQQVALCWRRHIDAGGRPMMVAVNVSPRQLVVPGFPEEVAQILESTGMPPEHLEIELTESVILDAVKTGGNAIQALHRLGVALSIDDFGTGLSSLRYLEQLPVDALKIDRSFVAGLDTRRSDGRSNAIPIAVIAMARSFGLDVIAEGVETPQQARMLIQLGCRRAQGYGLRRPSSWTQAIAPL